VDGVALGVFEGAEVHDLVGQAVGVVLGIALGDLRLSKR